MIQRPNAAHFALTLPGLTIKVCCSEPSVSEALQRYYLDYQHPAQHQAKLEVWVIQGPVPEQVRSQTFTPVSRESGKQTGKEAYWDAPEGRWIHKVRTGLFMLQRTQTPAVVGEVTGHLSQVVNFINNQWINHCVNQGCQLGHASAFRDDRGMTAIAAGSGGGKSTLMLRCLEQPGTQFVTNDRLMFRPEGGQTLGWGVPKAPRVNPGTLLNAPRLRSILPDGRQQALSSWSMDQLWSLEEKYDVPIAERYGADRVSMSAVLTRLVMLDWSHDSLEPLELQQVDLAYQSHTIDGLTKRAGPFYQTADGQFPPLDELDHSAYLHALGGVEVYRLAGRVDFERAAELLLIAQGDSQ